MEDAVRQHGMEKRSMFHFLWEKPGEAFHLAISMQILERRQVLLEVYMMVEFTVIKMNEWTLVGNGWASCLVWRKQAKSYSPVWPRGTPCPKPSPANACTLSWSMDDMLVAAMGARAG